MLRKTEKEAMGRRAWYVAVEICRIGYSLQETYESVNELERLRSLARAKLCYWRTVAMKRAR